VGALAVSVDDRPDSPVIQVTISIGVTAVAKGEAVELTDLLAAADSALYHAKQSGRNHVAFAPPEKNMGIDTLTSGTLDGGVSSASTALSDGVVLNNHRVVLVQTDQTAVSLCLDRSLSAVDQIRHAGTGF
jgi:predicted signal transduction protein with EAL and GGDEF domain